MFLFKKLLELAEAGCVEAQHDVGVMYLNGEGVGQQLDEGVKWIRLAANQGFSLAQHRLGVMYRAGIGVKQNEFKSRGWFLKSGRSERLVEM